MLSLPCTRQEAEALDNAAETLFLDLDDPPVLSFLEAEADRPDSWVMQSYFGSRPSSGMIEALCALIPSARGIRPKVEHVSPRDWVTVSQQGLEPIQAGRFHVRNRPEDPRSPGHVDLLIPAGRAFGTGQHETTLGCLEILDAMHGRGERFGNIADIGTGTGLLAFAALHLWPHAHVIASDIDPEAVAVSRENCARNGVAEGAGRGRLTLVTAAGTDHLEIGAGAPYDLLVANILAGPLIALAPSFAAHLAEGGSLVLAGLLAKQMPDVITAYQRVGLRLAGRIEHGHWPTLHLRKRRRFGWRRPGRHHSAAGSLTPGYGSW